MVVAEVARAGLQAQAQEAGFLINPSHGGQDSVSQGIGLVKRRMRDGTSFFTEALTQRPSVDGRVLNGESWYDRMRRYRWDEQPDETKAAKGQPLKRDDDTPDADRYMAEEADGFPGMSTADLVSAAVRKAYPRSAA